MQIPNLHHNGSDQEKTGIFADRSEAGLRLAELFAETRLTRPLVLAIPAGGVPVAVSLAGELHAPLDVLVVSKITLPWTTEAGYGAVACDGSTLLNQELIRQTGLSRQQIAAGISATRDKVQRRQQLFHPSAPVPEPAGREVILVDDGLASGYTMQVAVTAMRRAGADRLLVAVPTAHEAAAAKLAAEVEALYCVNLRSGWSYSVAAAYRHWQDVSETEAIRRLRQYCQPAGSHHHGTAPTED